MTYISVGFTGTQKGMALKQATSFENEIAMISAVALNGIEFHHGDDLGADREANDLMESSPYCQKIVVHPPSKMGRRALCISSKTEICDPKPYLARNKDIVNESVVLIAAPSSRLRQVRSGTWATVRYAEEMRRPIIFIYPDGSIDKGE